jgi:nucleoside-diphosphate-sugar epimerase
MTKALLTGAGGFIGHHLVWRPANNFLKAVESESQFFRAKAANKPRKIVKLFAGRDTSWSVKEPRLLGERC